LKQSVYLDNGATTPMDPSVLEAMLPYYREHFGNPASAIHAYGLAASQAVETARRQVAQLIGARPGEIIWTSGATESDNLAITGIAQKYRDKGNHIITCRTEHKAVLDTCEYLGHKGFEITYLPVDREGMIDLEQLRQVISEQTILISLMAVNNETGIIHPVAQIGAIARERGVFFHCDATQAAGKVPIDVKAMKIDLLSLSGHKIYGPKGVGALYVSDRQPRVRPAAIIHGGGHEQGMRSGTLNVPGIVGLGRACEICREVMPQEAERLKKLADRLYHGIIDRVDCVSLNGHRDNGVGHILNLAFAYVEGETFTLMMDMRGVAVSTGSACTSTSLGPSHVLRAMGAGDEVANVSIRFSLGRFNTEEEIDYAVESVIDVVRKAREISPLYEAAIKQKGKKPDALQR